MPLRVRLIALAAVSCLLLGTAVAVGDTSIAAVAGARQQAFLATPIGEGANVELPEDPEREALSVQAVDVGRKAAEPTVGVQRDGTAFFAAADLDGVVSGTGARTELLRSKDGGLTWKSVQPTAPVVKSVPPANADPYVWVDPKTDRVYNLDLAGCGYVQASDDKGETYTTSLAACGDSVDHQTLFGGPRPAGLKLPKLQGEYPTILYYCSNRVVDSRCGRSLDGGRTWITTLSPAYPGFDATVGGICNGLHGHGVVDRDGRIFLPKGHCGLPFVSISEDGGDTWTRVQVATEPAGDPPLPAFRYAGAFQHTSVAVDDAGNVYYVWPGKDLRPYLAVSRDNGRTWSKPLLIAPPGVNEVNFPTIDAGSAGNVAITFVGSPATSPGVLGGGNAKRPWLQYVMVSTHALDARPLMLSTTTSAPDNPVHRGDCFSRCGGMYDFLDVIVAPSGEVWATSSDTCTSAACVAGTSAGADGGVGRGVAIRQLDGPRLRTPSPTPSGVPTIMPTSTSTPTATPTATATATPTSAPTPPALTG